MKITFLTQRMALGYGVEVVVDRQARGLLDRGHQVEVLAARVEELYRDGPYAVVPLAGGAGDLFSGSFRRRVLPGLTRRETDVWVIHSEPFFGWAPALPTPSLLVDHGTPPGRFFSPGRGLALEAQVHWRHQGFQRLPDWIELAAISQFVRRSYPRPVQDRARVLPNGWDHYRRGEPREGRELRGRLGLSEEDLVLLTVGRIGLGPEGEQPYKNTEKVLGAYRQLREGHPALRLVVAGRANQEEQAAIREAGAVPAPDVPADEMPGLYAAADLFATASVWEGCNLPLAEALHQGLPVVAARMGAHGELIRHGETGLLSDTGQEFSRLLEQLIRQPGLRGTLGEAAREEATQRGWDRNLESLETMLVELAQRIPGPSQSLPSELRRRAATLSVVLRQGGVSGTRAWFRERRGRG